MATLTVKQFQEKLNRKITELESDKILKTAVLAVNEQRMKRIFEDGKNSAGGQIGTYNSTKPIYISPEQSPRKGTGLGARGPFSKGKPTKTGITHYDSYKDFRAAMGRESNFVNLRLNNELQGDLANGQVSKSSNTIAAPKPIKVSNAQYKVTLKKDINIKKTEGLESKYGKFLDHTKAEIDLFNKVIQTEINLLMAK